MPHHPSKPPSSRAALRGLIAAFAVSAVGFGAMTPFLVVWGHRSAGLSGAGAGLLFVAQAVGEITGGLGGGLLADRVGGRQVLLISTVGMAVGYGSLAFVHAPLPALVIIFAAGLFEAAYHPTAFALVADLTEPGERPHAYSLIRAAGNLGSILGPLAGAAVVAGVSLPDVFLVVGGLLAAAGVVALLALPRRGLAVSLDDEAEEIQAAVPGLAAIARDRRLGLLVAGGGLLAITLTWWEADGLAILHTQRAFGTSAFSIMLALSAALTVVFQIPVTRLTRGRPVARLIGGGAALQAVGLALLALASSGLGLIVVAVVLISFGDMVSGPNLSTLVAEIAPAGRGVTYQAAVSTTADIGQALGPASGLGLSAAVGAPLLWAISLPLGLLAGTISARAARLSAPVETAESARAAETASR